MNADAGRRGRVRGRGRWVRDAFWGALGDRLTLPLKPLISNIDYERLRGSCVPFPVLALGDTAPNVLEPSLTGNPKREDTERLNRRSRGVAFSSLS